MIKNVFCFLLLPFILSAQIKYSTTLPYKSDLTKYLKPSQEPFILDTNNTGYSILEYRSFSSNGQFVSVNHQQNITDFILFNLNFHKFSQEGIFNRETLKLHDVQSNLMFKNKKENYLVDLSLGYSKIRMDENGGISDYNTDNYNDPLLFPVNLLSAQNEVKNRMHNIAQKFNFTDKWSIAHKFSILSNRKTYSDNSPMSGYYESIFLDSTATVDSLSTIDYKSTFSINYNSISFSQLLYSRKAFIHSIDSTDYDLGIGINFSIPKYNIDFSSELYQSSHFTSSLLKSIYRNQSSHHFDLSFNKSRVPIFNNNFISNHFLFNNRFNHEQRQYFRYKLKFVNGTFTTQLNRIVDYIYLNQKSALEQVSNPILHTNTTINYHTNISKIHFSQYLQHQFCDNLDVLRVPMFNSSTSIWYETDLFNQNLNTKLGAKVDYFSAYYANAYNPALGDFYLQDFQAIGDAPLISAFLNLDLHNMFIALEYYNFGDLLDLETVYFIPNYPVYPSTIRLSISWKLFNK